MNEEPISWTIELNKEKIRQQTKDYRSRNRNALILLLIIVIMLIGDLAVEISNELQQSYQEILMAIITGVLIFVLTVALFIASEKKNVNKRYIEDTHGLLNYNVSNNSVLLNGVEFPLSNYQFYSDYRKTMAHYFKKYGLSTPSNYDIVLSDKQFLPHNSLILFIQDDHIYDKVITLISKKLKNVVKANT